MTAVARTSGKRLRNSFAWVRELAIYLVQLPMRKKDQVGCSSDESWVHPFRWEAGHVLCCSY